MEVTVLGSATGQSTQDRTESLAAGLPILLSELTDKLYVTPQDTLAFKVAQEYETIGSGEVVAALTPDYDLSEEQEQSFDLSVRADNFYHLRGILSTKGDLIIVLGLSPSSLATISFVACRQRQKQLPLVIFEPSVDQRLPPVLNRELAEVNYVQSLSDVEARLKEQSSG